MDHHFKVGDQVRLNFGFHDQDAVGTYAVTRLLPTSDDGDPQYRVRGMDDRERVIGEAQINWPGRPNSPARPRSPHNPITEMFNRLLKPKYVHGGEKTIQWSACVCAGAGGVKVGHWIG